MCVCARVDWTGERAWDDSDRLAAGDRGGGECECSSGRELFWPCLRATIGCRRCGMGGECASGRSLVWVRANLVGESQGSPSCARC